MIQQEATTNFHDKRVILQFRRVKGYHQLPTLAHALRHTVSAHTDQSPVAVTA
jgi:hypothetical protein